MGEKRNRRLAQFIGVLGCRFRLAEKFLVSGHINDTACLILDLQLPGLNGLELQNQLLVSGSRTPIIFITAFADPKSREPR